MLAHFAGARFLIFPRKRNVVMQSQALNCKGGVMCTETFSDRKLSIINQLKVTTWYRKIPFVCVPQLIHLIKGCVSSLKPKAAKETTHSVFQC